MVNSTPSLALALDDWLPLIGWLMIFCGQVLVTARRRAGLAVWMASSAVFIALNLRTGLHWSALIFATNFAWCGWSYWRWTSKRRTNQRRLFDGLARR